MLQQPQGTHELYQGPTGICYVGSRQRRLTANFPRIRYLAALKVRMWSAKRDRSIFLSLVCSNLALKSFSKVCSRKVSKGVVMNSPYAAMIISSLVSNDYKSEVQPFEQMGRMRRSAHASSFGTHQLVQTNVVLLDIISGIYELMVI